MKLRLSSHLRSFRYVVPLVAIGLAALAVIGIPQQFGFTTDQIVFAMLGILST